MILAEPVQVVFAFALGAMLGSFLNVCVYRLPRNESVIHPRSHCPSCGALIAWYDNVPIVSWLVLGARCRHCRAPISVRYPLIELATAVIWGAALLLLGPSLAALKAAVFATLLLGSALTDARHYLIPDEFSLGGLGAGLAFAIAAALLTLSAGPLLVAVVGAASGYAVLWVVKAGGDWALARGLIGGEELSQVLEDGERRTTLGAGDLKLMAMVGCFVGWQGVLLTAFLGSLAGVAVFVPLLLLKRRTPVPFGVFLAAGGLATLLFGSSIIRWYAGIFRP